MKRYFTNWRGNLVKEFMVAFALFYIYVYWWMAMGHFLASGEYGKRLDRWFKTATILVSVLTGFIYLVLVML